MGKRAFREKGCTSSGPVIFLSRSRRFSDSILGRVVGIPYFRLILLS
jgi:hypothetical protein